MRGLWPLAVITFKEGIRNRALYGIAIFALLLLGISQLVSAMIMRDVGKVAIDMALSTVSFCGLLIVFFVGINLIAKDFDRKTIYMVLSRPISRSQYVWGKFFGLALLVLTTTVTLGVCALASIFVAKVSYPTYFMRFSAMEVVLAIGYIALSLLLLTAVSFFFASFTSTSFICLILTVITWLIGQTSNDVRQLLEVKSTVGIATSPLVDKVVTAAFYIFPNFALFDIKLAAAHALPVEPSSVFWTTLYAFCYTVMVLYAASQLFRRREFP